MIDRSVKPNRLDIRHQTKRCRRNDKEEIDGLAEIITIEHKIIFDLE